MIFGMALELMKTGHSVARASWGPPHHLRLALSGNFIIEHCGPNCEDPWRPASEDLLAEDWELVERP